MIPEEKLKLSLEEMSIRGAKILAQRFETTFEKSFEQAQRLKLTLLVNSSSKKNKLVS